MIEMEETPRPAARAHELLRASHAAHFTLSQMADTKASILMAATFVTFTITVGQSRDGAGPPLPLLVLGGFAFIAAILTVLAIMPATAPPKMGRLNLLFFGAYAPLSEQEYLTQMRVLLQSDERIIDAMTIDIYQNGQVLGRKKYKLLSYAYRVFVIGMSASLLTFVIERYF